MLLQLNQLTAEKSQHRVEIRLNLPDGTEKRGVSEFDFSLGRRNEADIRGIALFNCFGNLGGFVGPYAIGAITKKTGSLQTGLVFVGISLFASAMLILALPKKRAPETGAVAMPQAKPAVIPTANIDP